jgi:hypothetical protein
MNLNEIEEKLKELMKEIEELKQPEYIEPLLIERWIERCLEWKSDFPWKREVLNQLSELKRLKAAFDKAGKLHLTEDWMGFEAGRYRLIEVTETGELV